MAEVNEVVTDAMKEVAKEAYDDFVHPVAKPTGELGSFLPRAIKAALAPLEKWILQKEYTMAAVKKSLEEKLKDVPPESITPPEPYIAVPALQYMSYCMDNEELREMYANLFANSMNDVVKDGVHPGFVEIIKQLCPDEAKILKQIVTMQSSVPVVTLRFENYNGSGVDVIENFSNIGESSECENPTWISRYFNNLDRLGLIEKGRTLSSLTNKELYIPLKEHPYITDCIEEVSEGNYALKNPRFVESYIKLTDFGRAFCSICLIAKQEEA